MRTGVPTERAIGNQLNRAGEDSDEDRTEIRVIGAPSMLRRELSAA